MWQQLLMNGLVAGSTYGLVALGFSVIYRVARFFHFAHAAVITCGAFIAWTLATSLGLPLVVALPISVFTSTLVGVSMEVFVYRPLRGKHASALVLLLASLGLYVLLQNAISLIYGDDLKSLIHGQALQGISIFHATITTVQLITLVANVVLYAAVGFLFARSRFGITIRGVADDPELALIVGVDRDRVMILVFALGSALAAIAGIFIGFDTSLSPTMGFRALLMGVVAAIIGGVGSIPGSILGGLFVGFLQNFGVWKLPTEWQDGVVFLALIVFLLLRPRGFLGKPLGRAPI